MTSLPTQQVGAGTCSGVCKKWFAERGFGFIERTPKDPAEGDIFVHFSGISQSGRKSLNIGENVTFDMGSDIKSGKPRAENVVGDESGTRSEDLYPQAQAQKTNVNTFQPQTLGNYQQTPTGYNNYSQQLMYQQQTQQYQFYQQQQQQQPQPPTYHSYSGGSYGQNTFV